MQTLTCSLCCVCRLNVSLHQTEVQQVTLVCLFGWFSGSVFILFYFLFLNPVFLHCKHFSCVMPFPMARRLLPSRTWTFNTRNTFRTSGRHRKFQVLINAQGLGVKGIILFPSPLQPPRQNSYSGGWAWAEVVTLLTGCFCAELINLTKPLFFFFYLQGIQLGGQR